VKRISIQDLKARVSAAVSEAEAGATIVVTRHNEPVAQLGPVRAAHLHGHASTSGDSRLKPAIKRGTKGRYLAVLLEDRGSR